MCACQWACKIAIFQKYNLAQKSLIEFMMYYNWIAVMFEKDTNMLEFKRNFFGVFYDFFFDFQVYM